MEIRIPADDEFDFYACKKLYKKYQKEIDDNVPFNNIIKNTFFYSFYDDKVLVGCVYLYYQKINNKARKSPYGLFLNGFAKRKYHRFNTKVLNKIFSWFNCNIYAKSVQKPAIYLLLKCGFKKISDDLYIYYNNLSKKGD